MTQLKKYKPFEMKPVLVSFFTNHIGEENATTREEVFTAVQGVEFNSDSMAHHRAWNAIRNGMAVLRKSTLCFVQSKRVGATSAPHKYFVSKRFKESSQYAEELSKHTSTRVKTVQYAQESVANKNYNKAWYE